jgi:aryl-alcohol dehydrogenase-like predicted oxidoreductase
MPDFASFAAIRRPLGATGVAVSRIGISSSFGADERVFSAAFERGCNYFTWGTFIRGRSRSFVDFFRNTITFDRRQDIVVGLLSYSHLKLWSNYFLHTALRRLGTEYIDVLLLGYYPKRPPNRILDWAAEAKQRGLIRAVGLTTHNRALVAELAFDPLVDVIHFRYNAVHRGAEQDIFPFVADTDIGLISFTATCWGKLVRSGKAKPDTPPASAGDCYRFVLSRPEIDCCMMGVKNLAMLNENLDELDKGEMSKPERRRMCALGDHLRGA